MKSYQAGGHIVFYNATIVDINVMLDQLGPLTLGKQQSPGLYHGRLDLDEAEFDRFVAQFGVPEPFPM